MVDMVYIGDMVDIVDKVVNKKGKKGEKKLCPVNV
jgi:hypothetical protein